ncbi:hypothetical protein JCM10450v2_006781 [Rhodotorula kratochvilovae]
MPPCWLSICGVPHCVTLPADIPPLLVSPGYLPLPFDEERKSPPRTVPPTGPPFWSLALEMQYQVFDEWCWLILSEDDRRDMAFLQVVENAVRACDVRSCTDCPTAARRWNEVAARRLLRWERLFALHSARARFLLHQRDLHPGLTNTEILTRSPAMERIVRQPGRTFWALPCERPLTAVKHGPSSHLVRATDPDLDLSPYLVADQRIFRRPPVPVHIPRTLTDPPSWSASSATLVDDVQPAREGRATSGALAPPAHNELHRRAPYTVC